MYKKSMKEMTNREKLETLGEGCSYEKNCDECEVKEKCAQEIEEK